MENRIIELETRLAFQEVALEELNTALVAQQAQLDQLTRECTRLAGLLCRALDPGEAARP